MSTDRTAARLTPAQRRRLRDLADLLLPEAHGMPSASAVGLHERGVDRVLDARPDLTEPLVNVLDEESELEPRVFVSRLREAAGEAWNILTLVVAGAYYMDADVRRRLNYPGQLGWQIDPFEYVGWIDEGLLDPVIARGQAYRSVD